MYRVRKCDTPNDMDVVYKMVQELAVYEQRPQSLEQTADDYKRDAFGSKQPLFYAAVAECNNDETWKPVGYAVWFYSYSTWKGRGFYLEDLYVKEEHRQKGVGRRLYSYCVKQAADAKCRVFDFVVLKWNTTALNVYKTFGITPRDGDDWHLMRMDATDIDKFMTNRYIE